MITLLPGDGVPDLVDLVANPLVGRTSLVTDSSSTFQAVSASPQPTYGCTSSGPMVVAGLDVNAVFRKPDPPSCLWEQWEAVGLAATIVTDIGACASVLGSGRDTGASLCVGLRSASFATSSGSGGDGPAGRLAVSEWVDTDDSAKERVF